MLFRCRWAAVDEVRLIADQGDFLTLARPGR